MPPSPEKEEARLQALRRYRILDTPRERNFDDIVQLAAEICNTPISLVSLVDRDRQWFKGHYGLDLRETPRRVSFCSHTIQQAPELMVINDASKDPRFADNELVTGKLQFRFYAGAPLVTPDGHALGTLCVIDRTPRELTEKQKDVLGILSRQVVIQLELRRRLAELSRTSIELAAANEELEGFAHAISHDLRTPLRATTSYAEVLLQFYASKLDARATDMLRNIEEGGKRMSQMLEDFLRLLRLKIHSLNCTSIDMPRLVDSVVGDLKPLTSASTAIFRIGPLPPAMADEGLLRQVWINLISNAIKFSRQRPAPLIEIGAKEEPEYIVYSVKDNGAGFKMEDAPKLWTAFRRLHGSRFEGTGLGLSIVRRIVQSHGGRVWAEGAPDQGATFYFTLPKTGS